MQLQLYLVDSYNSYSYCYKLGSANACYIAIQLIVYQLQQYSKHLSMHLLHNAQNFTLVIQLAGQLARSQLYNLAITRSKYILLLYNGLHYSYSRIIQLQLPSSMRCAVGARSTQLHAQVFYELAIYTQLTMEIHFIDACGSTFHLW